MTKIITVIIKILNTINKLSWKIIIFLTKFIKIEELDKINSKPDDVRYRHFSVDKPAIIEAFKEPEKLDFKVLVKENNISPVKRRKGKTINVKVSCPRCDAPKEYLYDNNGKEVQFECKCCKNIFSINSTVTKHLNYKCPHCHYKLYKKHERESFDVYTCPNKKCSFYLRNKNSINVIDKEKFKNNPNFFKLHYIYRAFKAEPETINKDYREFVRTPIDLSKAYYSWDIIGHCLTFHVNYGMSYRQTSALIFDLYQIKISHQTVANYCNAVASIIHPVLELYPYNLSNSIAGDETYIKVLGKQHYVFFMFDTLNKIITSYRCFDKRDSISAIKTLYSTLIKYDTIPDDLKMIFDGNPIYQVGQQYWAQHGYNFDLFQVIGLKNTDPISSEYRSYKQIIERHNRTFKYYYKSTNGLTSIHHANSYMILFSACFNFLRPHSSLKYKVPVHDENIQSMPTMPAKWITIIEMGYQYTKTYN
ncbi:MAG: DDE-type integrase/transposase/recombinase [Bacilli bacterium]